MRDGPGSGPPRDEGASSEREDVSASSLASSEKAKDPVLAEIARQLVVAGPIEPDKTVVEPTQDLRAGGRSAGPVPLQRGAQVGRYLVLDTLGSGGMGVVYAAYDPKLDRRIALKLLRSDEVGADASARLSREAQAMARLSHPNVVAVYDVGTIGANVFVAMEFVQGETLAAWLRERKRGVAEVLAVFRLAGAGLAAAHAAGIIHRDFKPDNVLIGDDGAVRVTDFGIARTDVFEEASGATPPATQGSASPALTEHGHVMGTPAYMAPEQAEAGVVGARSDLFSFCVALYEALYGERPFAGRAIAELRDAALRGAVREPPRGSSVPVWIRRILLSGLAGDPANRPVSMAALLASLARDPVARRRRALWGSAVFAVVGGALTLAAWGLYARAPTCAGAERKLGEIWDPPRREVVHAAFAATGAPYAETSWGEVERVLSRVSRAWAVMYTDVCEATHARGEQSERLLDLRMLCLDVRRKELAALVEVFARADIGVVERAAQAVHALRGPEGCADIRTLQDLEAPPSDPMARARLEETHTLLAKVKALRQSGKWKEALAAAKEAVAQARALGYRPALAEALFLVGQIENLADNFGAAQQSLEEALWTAEAGRDDEIGALAASLLVNVVGFKQHLFREGERWGKQAAAILERMGGPPGLEAALLGNLGTLAWAEGRYEQALTYHQRASAHWESLPDSDGKALALNRFGVSLWYVGRYEEALGVLRRAVALLLKLSGPLHPGLARARGNLGNQLLALGRYDEAIAELRAALGILEKAFGPTDNNVASVLLNLGNALQVRGRLAEARVQCQRSLRIFEATSGTKTAHVAYPISCLADVLEAEGRYEEALQHYERALSILQAKFGAGHPSVGEVLTSIAQVHLKRGAVATAISLLRQALSKFEARKPPPASLALARFVMARALWRSGRDREQARVLAAQARDGFARDGPASERDLAKVREWLVRHSAPHK
jgi:tetratricopeptide (TPR) repeat protein